MPVPGRGSRRILGGRAGTSTRRGRLTASLLLGDAEVERFTHAAYLARLGLVVVHDARLVAVGRSDRIPGKTDAEFAFVVADAYQGEGIGTLLADDLATAARAGVDGFVAETLSENAWMLELLDGLGFPVTARVAGGVVRVAFRIDRVTLSVQRLAGREETRAVRPLGAGRGWVPRGRPGPERPVPC